MKQSSNSRRSRGRNNGGKRPGNRNGNFDSHGPDGRIRGNASQVHEKYLSLARDALAIDDRISSENYSQHAEHFYRIIAHNAEMQVNNEKNNPNESPVIPADQANISEKNTTSDQNEKHTTSRRNNRSNNRNRGAKNKELDENSMANNNLPQTQEEIKTVSGIQNQFSQDDTVQETAMAPNKSDEVSAESSNEADGPPENILA
jgi:hypothetical protein